jgi:hypothetical protein
MYVSKLLLLSCCLMLGFSYGYFCIIFLLITAAVSIERLAIATVAFLVLFSSDLTDCLFYTVVQCCSCSFYESPHAGLLLSASVMLLMTYDLSAALLLFITYGSLLLLGSGTLFIAAIRHALVLFFRLFENTVLLMILFRNKRSLVGLFISILICV